MGLPQSRGAGERRSACKPPCASCEDATGIADPALHWGEDYRETVAFDDGRVSRYYLAQASDNEVTLRVPAGEAAEDYGYRWVTVEEAEDLLPPRLAIVLDWVVARLAGGHLQH